MAFLWELSVLMCQMSDTQWVFEKCDNIFIIYLFYLLILRQKEKLWEHYEKVPACTQDTIRVILLFLN